MLAQRLLCLVRRQHHQVGADLSDELRAMFGLDFPSLLEHGRVAKQQFGVTSEFGSGGCGDLTSGRLGEHGEVPADQPGISCRMDGHDPADDEHPLSQRGEGPASYVGIGAVDEIVEKVVQFGRVAIEPMDLEVRLNDIAPAEHHRAFVIREPRAPLLDKPFDHGAAVGEPVLQREAVDDRDGRGLVQVAVEVGGLGQRASSRLAKRGPWVNATSSPFRSPARAISSWIEVGLVTVRSAASVICEVIACTISATPKVMIPTS